MSMRKVLVTGGTGFVGRAVVRELGKRGYAVRLLTRHKANRSGMPWLAPEAEVALGDVTDPAGLGAAARGADAVIHLVGIISETRRITYERVHAEGTRNLLAAVKEAGVRRFIHMSALGTRPNARSRYHQTKWAAEEEVRNSGLDFTIFRPSLIYGPEDDFVNLFARMARWSPVLPVMGSGSARLAPILVAEVARGFVGALNHPAAVGRTFDLCGTETLTFPEILRTILRVMNRRRWLVHAPLGLARVQAATLEFAFGTLLGKPPPLNRDQIIMLQEDNVGDPAPAQSLFGLRTTTFADGIRAFLTEK